MDVIFELGEASVACGFGRVKSLKRRLAMIMEGTTPRRLSGVGRLAVIAIAICSLPLRPTVGQERSTASDATAAADKQTEEEPDAKAAVAEVQSKETQAGPAADNSDGDWSRDGKTIAFSSKKKPVAVPPDK